MTGMQQSTELAITATATAASSFLWMPVLPEQIILIAFSGLCGGVSRWVAAREKFWPAGVSSVLLGIIAAIFLWPVAEPTLEPMLGRLEMDPITRVMFGAYTTGLMGVTLITLITDFRIAKRREDEE